MTCALSALAACATSPSAPQPRRGDAPVALATAPDPASTGADAQRAPPVVVEAPPSLAPSTPAPFGEPFELIPDGVPAMMVLDGPQVRASAVFQAVEGALRRADPTANLERAAACGLTLDRVDRVAVALGDHMTLAATGSGLGVPATWRCAVQREGSPGPEIEQVVIGARPIEAMRTQGATLYFLDGRTVVVLEDAEAEKAFVELLSGAKQSAASGRFSSLVNPADFRHAVWVVSIPDDPKPSLGGGAKILDVRGWARFDAGLELQVSFGTRSPAAAAQAATDVNRELDNIRPMLPNFGVPEGAMNGVSAHADVDRVRLDVRMSPADLDALLHFVMMGIAGTTPPPPPPRARPQVPIKGAP